jgi:hypothetical protein
MYRKIKLKRVAMYVPIPIPVMHMSNALAALHGIQKIVKMTARQWI